MATIPSEGNRGRRSFGPLHLTESDEKLVNSPVGRLRSGLDQGIWIKGCRSFIARVRLD
jgi:hypothetical protein